jgi:hypothetical protein
MRPWRRLSRELKEAGGAANGVGSAVVYVFEFAVNDVGFDDGEGPRMARLPMGDGGVGLYSVLRR